MAPMKLRNRLLTLALVLAVLGLAGYAAARIFLPQVLARWVAGPQFERMLANAVGHALKVEGKFGPLTLNPDLSVTAENFSSTGWPGQAIGGLDAGRATGWFNPSGILRGRWEVDRIDIAQANFRVVAPNNELKKQDPVIPPKPWYAFLMPSQFHCGWIECPDMTIELPLGPTPVRGAGMHLGAMMVGRNFKYFGRGGHLVLPGYPDLAIDGMEVYVTHALIDIGYLYLREPASAQSNLELKARLGQQADKSIDASAQITALDIAPFLPHDIAAVLSGQLDGKLTYRVDPAGKNASGEGLIALQNARLRDWNYLDRLAERAGQPAWRNLALSRVSLDYQLEGALLRAKNIVVLAPGLADLRGSGSWNMETAEAAVEVSASGIPLGAYLPASLTGSLAGELAADLSWAWHGTKVAEGRGGGTLRFTGGRLEGFQFQKFLDRFLKSKAYTTIAVTRASAHWQEDRRGLHLDQLDVLAPEQAGLRGAVRVAPDGTLAGTVRAGLPASALAWLPGATKTVFARQEDGLHWCEIELSGTVKKPVNNLTAQVMHQLEKHPLAMAELALRGLSWWLGDALGTEDEG
jgi:hypothetical protein